MKGKILEINSLRQTRRAESTNGCVKASVYWRHQQQQQRR